MNVVFWYKNASCLTVFICVFQLRAQLQAGPSEIAKAAQSLNELSELWQPEEELSGIELIEQDQRVLVRLFTRFLIFGEI